MLTRIADTLIDLNDVAAVQITGSWHEGASEVVLTTKRGDTFTLLGTKDQSECEKLMNQIEALMTKVCVSETQAESQQCHSCRLRPDQTIDLREF